ncbi:hypothetical protein BJ973_004911 [Actinoplanes tereljensis]|uniref:Uncharacterized protein n=1 Tax=Paractinoplanes tereljensis TaxID=571912 RepID=A0A919NP25_9ACTN|nr:hypothetical protein [Actinoplanes tereljensis]GIF21645.1 hypothetical protein Ate02nite_43750 [Actinoplanes tereljensis]
MIFRHPALRILVPIATVVVAVAYVLVEALSGSDASRRLTFTYHQHNGSGMMDQTLEIFNPALSAVVPTLEIVPVDSSGAVVAGVRVSTAYGSDKGRLLAPGRAYSLDVLAFAGDDVSRVADVRVTVRASAKAEFPVTPLDVEVQTFDVAGEQTSKVGPFWSVELTNPNPEKVAVGVVCILWDQPLSSQPQQALAVLPVGVAAIAGEGSTTMRADGEAADGCGSLKAYFIPLDQV